MSETIKFKVCQPVTVRPHFVAHDMILVGNDGKFFILKAGDVIPLQVPDGPITVAPKTHPQET